ncbi:MAG: UDP-glucose/GDP-mannose dehydrogenase family protein [Acidimicrobiia bacterium]|nr:UDP-glucose/GDP-mannose dehydrogenase family protein [Acidimicrobiia bacterium]
MRIVIVGAGVVGTATGKGFAHRGHAVSFVDVSMPRIDSLRNEGLSASDELDLGGPPAIVLVSVPTPSGPPPAGYDLGALRSALGTIGEAVRDAAELPTVVLRSTVPPGTCERVARPILEERSGRRQGEGFALASNPEFLRAACALEDFLRPRMTVIGARSKATQELLRTLYEPLGGEIRVFTDPTTAEFVKITHNLFNAAKISFFNELWLVASSLGLDARAAAETISVSAEASWNPEYGIRGGAPFGGACLPKDTRGFIAFAENEGIPVPLAAAVEAVNSAVSAPGSAVGVQPEGHLDLREPTSDSMGANEPGRRR